MRKCNATERRTDGQPSEWQCNNNKDSKTSASNNNKKVFITLKRFYVRNEKLLLMLDRRPSWHTANSFNDFLPNLWRRSFQIAKNGHHMRNTEWSRKKSSQTGRRRQVNKQDEDQNDRMNGWMNGQHCMNQQMNDCMNEEKLPNLRTHTYFSRKTSCNILWQKWLRCTEKKISSLIEND